MFTARRHLGGTSNTLRTTVVFGSEECNSSRDGVYGWFTAGCSLQKMHALGGGVPNEQNTDTLMEAAFAHCECLHTSDR